MSATPNNTLPNEWRDDRGYSYGETVYYAGIIYKCIQSYEYDVEHPNPHNPGLDTNNEWWKPIDIYKKDETVMPHGDYSGDESFWDRDQLYVDDNGDVYINGIKTGINTRGPAGTAIINFDVLTPSQIEQLRGPQGIQGPQGPQGAEGPQGPMGEVILTPEQVAALKGDDGKSAYDIWLEQGYIGTEADFVSWLRSGIITLDTQLSTESDNGITNSAITRAFNSYRNQVTALVNSLQSRVTSLENRLKATYNGDDILFKFGVTTEGRYGYYINGTNQLIPFVNQTDDAISSQFAERNDPNIFQEQFGYGAVDVAMTTIESQLAEEASLNNDPSGTDEDPTILYGATQMRSLADIQPKTYLYQNGAYNREFGYNLYSMDNATFTSLNTVNVEGIWLMSVDLTGSGGTLYITVEPVTEGDTINYQIGNFSDDRASLPTLVSAGTYRLNYQNGTFDERITLQVDITDNKGCYFASTLGGEYRIVEIYTE